jgi:hypothetical protein
LTVPQYTKQRVSRPDYGLREDVLLPWYRELARQYTAQPYGAHWAGNRTLIELYESLAWTAGEDRWGVVQPLGFHFGLVVCTCTWRACIFSVSSLVRSLLGVPWCGPTGLARTRTFGGSCLCHQMRPLPLPLLPWLQQLGSSHQHEEA